MRWVDNGKIGLVCGREGRTKIWKYILTIVVVVLLPLSRGLLSYSFFLFLFLFPSHWLIWGLRYRQLSIHVPISVLSLRISRHKLGSSKIQFPGIYVSPLSLNTAINELSSTKVKGQLCCRVNTLPPHSSMQYLQPRMPTFPLSTLPFYTCSSQSGFSGPREGFGGTEPPTTSRYRDRIV
jgi:hypothetical protein